MTTLVVSEVREHLTISIHYLVKLILLISEKLILIFYFLFFYDFIKASPDSIATTFTLYTRNNPLNGEILDYENLILSNNSTFNSTNDVKIIIHGFGSSSKRPWVIKMTETLLGLDDFNVINVDWQNGSKLPNYVQAVG